MWGAYAVLAGCVGGKAFRDEPWLAFALAFGIAVVMAGAGLLYDRIARSREG